MKVFVCKVKKTTVQEAVMYVEVPSKRMALDKEWVFWSDETYDTSQCFEETSCVIKIVSASEIKSINQVPKSDLEIVPYNHPNHEPNHDMDLSELLRDGDVCDNSEHIKSYIDTREKQVAEAQKQINELKAMLSKSNKATT